VARRYCGYHWSSRSIGRHGGSRRGEGILPVLA
jgi:hypothetical protein